MSLSKRRSGGAFPASSNSHAHRMHGVAAAAATQQQQSPVEIMMRLRVRSSDEERAAQEEAKGNENQIWAEVSEECLVASIREKMSNGKIKVELANGTTMEIDEDSIERVNPPKFDRVEDMSNLTYLSEPAVYENLKQRYVTGYMYTNSGLSLIAVNPYKDLGIYGPKIIEAFEQTPQSDHPPHIYSVALAAYTNMMFNHGASQSILCTGESGAGKTQNCKQALRCLTWLSNKNSRQIEEAMEEASGDSLLEKQIIAANPILESFGNAKTIKNENSSRFGKFNQIGYESTGTINSARILTFLLEKSRVTTQGPDERNFHIFYIACEGLPMNIKNQCLLEDISSYKIITNGVMNVRDIPSKAWADDLMQSFELFKIDPIAVFKVVSGILALGNLEFEQEGSKIIVSNDPVLQKVASLLQIDAQTLKSAITEPTIKIGTDITKVSQTVEQCQESTHSLIRAIYECLFHYLVKLINRVTACSGIANKYNISLVDIAGFEIFQKNSFEQLCINNTNEKLQQFFNHKVFEAEQEEYTQEKIKWDYVDYGLDLQPTIDLINGTTKERGKSIFGLINECSMFAAFKDKDLNDKINDNCKGNDKFVKPTVKENHNFGIMHYAGLVQYTIDDWVRKNKHPLHADLLDAMKTSREAFISDMFKGASYSSEAGSKTATAFGQVRIRSGTLQTGLQSYTDQLNQVMSALEMTNPHFVRCIIPNLRKMPLEVNYRLVKDQLRCNGIIEGIRIVRKGYPNRVPFSTFKSQYHSLSKSSKNSQYADSKQFSVDLLKELAIDTSLYQIGTSKIFFKSEVLGALEELKNKMLGNYIEVLQALVMKYYYGLLQNKALFSKTAVETIRSNIRIWYKLKSNAWFRLVARIKPTVESRSQEQEAKKLQDANSTLKKKLDETTAQLEAQNDLLEKKKSELLDNRDELSEMRLKFESVSDELNATQNNMEQLAEYATKCEEEIKEAQREKSSLSARVSDIESTLNTTTEQLNEAESARQALGVEKSRYVAQIKELEERIAVLDEEVARLRSQVASQETQNQALVKELEVLKSRMSQSSKRSDEMNDAIVESEKDLSVTKQQLAKVNSQYNALRHELEVANDSIADFKDKYDRLQSINERNNKNLLAMEESGQSMQRQRSELENQLNVVENNLEMLQDDYDNLKAKYDGEKRQVAALEQEKSDLADSMMSSAEEAKLLDKQVRTNLESEKKKSESLETELDELRKKSQADVNQLKNTHASEISQLKSKMQALEKSAKQMGDDLQNTSDELEKYRSKSHESESLNKKLESKISELNYSLSALQGEKDTLDAQSGTLNSKLRADKERIENLQNEVEGLRRGLSVGSAEQSSLNEQITSLNDERRKLKSKISDLETSLEESFNERADLEDKLMQRDSMLQSQSSKIGSLEQRVAALQEESDERDERIHALVKEKDLASDELVEARKSHAQLQKQNKHLLNETDNLEASISQLKSEVESAKKSSKGAESTTKALKLTIEQNEQKITELESESLRKDSKLNRVTKQLAESDDQLASMASKNKELEALLQEASSNSASEEKLLRVTRELNEKRAELEQTLVDNDELTEQVEKLQNDVHQLNQKLHNSQMQYQNELNVKSDEMNAAIAQLRSKINESDAENMQLQHRIKSMGKDSKQFATHSKELEEQVKTLQEKLDSISQSEKRSSGDVKQLRHDLATSEDSLKQLQQQLASANSRCNSFKHQCLESDTTISKLQARCKSLQAELEQQTTAADTALASASRFKKASSEAQIQVSNLTEEVEDLESRLQQSHSEVSRFKSDLTSTQNELMNLRDTQETENLVSESKRKHLEQSINDSEMEASKYRNQAKLAKRELNDLHQKYESDVSQVKNESMKLNSKLKSAKKEIEELRGQASEYETKLNSISRQNKDMSNEVRKLRLLNKELLKEASEAKERIHALFDNPKSDEENE